MKKIKYYLFLLLLLGVCVIGCGEKETAEPVEESMELGEDFRVTISSAQSWYTSGDFKKNCQFTMKLEYIGEEEEIQIYHGEPLSSIGIKCENGKFAIGGGSIKDVETSTLLKKGKAYEITFDAEALEMYMDLEKYADADEENEYYDVSVIKNGSLKKGVYKVVGYVDFSTGKNLGEGEKYEVELPLTFEIR